VVVVLTAAKKINITQSQKKEAASKVIAPHCEGGRLTKAGISTNTLCIAPISKCIFRKGDFTTQ